MISKRVKPEELKVLYEKLSSKDQKLTQVLQENEELRKQMASQRSHNTQTRKFHVDKISEAQTRKKYIDIALKEAMKSLSEREKTIINMRYYGGKTQMEIASFIGISQAQVTLASDGRVISGNFQLEDGNVVSAKVISMKKTEERSSSFFSPSRKFGSDWVVTDLR